MVKTLQKTGIRYPCISTRTPFPLYTLNTHQGHHYAYTIYVSHVSRHRGIDEREPEYKSVCIVGENGRQDGFLCGRVHVLAHVDPGSGPEFLFANSRCLSADHNSFIDKLRNP